jgi:acyl-CoA reductase-like NAD-dependent aldehyde dehydrogenase
MSTGRGGTGSAVASLKGLGGLYFTGSYKTGIEIASHTAPNLVKVQLELGGKDPAYVRKDVLNVAAAALSIADGAFYNCGQLKEFMLINRFMESFCTISLKL